MRAPTPSPTATCSPINPGAERPRPKPSEIAAPTPMASCKNGLATALAVVVLLLGGGGEAASGKLEEVVQPSWATDHVVYAGDLLQLRLDTSSGAGLASKKKYLYGKASADIKLVPGDSAGVVTAFYMSSEGEKHNEFDFEFLGNVSGEPYLVQTNLYIDGAGDREQRIDLWFDPTADFHSYAILWNPSQVVFLVDDTPIRVYHNRSHSHKNHHRNATANSSIPFPGAQPMGLYSSIWNADDWATQGGRVKTDWSHAPFVTTYRDVRIDACEWGNVSGAGAGGGECGESAWGKGMEELSVHQSHQLLWARAHHLVYDYCADEGRFPVPPPECAAGGR